MKAELILRQLAASSCNEIFYFFILIFVISKLYLVADYGKFRLFFGTCTRNALFEYFFPPVMVRFLYRYK